MTSPAVSMGLSAASNSSSSNFPNFPGLPALMASLGDRSQTSNYNPQHQPQLANGNHAQESNASDLERLERLKKEILDGQNPVYKAVPRPDYLKSLYLGRSLQEKSPSPVQHTVPSAAVHSGEASGISGEALVKQEDNEDPLHGFQMSDILALSSKLLSRNSFTFSNGPNGVEAHRKPKTEANGTFSNAAGPSQSHSREASQLPPDSSRRGSVASGDALEQRMRSTSETLRMSDPPYDPKEGLSSSSLYTRLPGDRLPSDIQMDHVSATGRNGYSTDHYNHYRHEAESLNGYRAHGSSLPYDAANDVSRDPADRVDRLPLEERDVASDHFTSGPVRPIGSLQDRIGQRIPHSATPVLSPTPSSGYRPNEHYDDSSRDHASHHPPPFDASEEFIRQAILESEATPDSHTRPTLEDRIDREHASFPPKFAAKRGQGYGSPHPPPPPDSDHEHTRHWSNASRPTEGSPAPVRRDSHGPTTSKPLSWDREAPIDPPSVYPPPPPSDHDSRPAFSAYRDYPRSRPVGRTPSPPAYHRRPSDEYGAPRPGMKRGREDDFHDVYDRRFPGFGRGQMSPGGGYYVDRGTYPYDYDRRPGDVAPARGMYRPDPPYLAPPRTA